MSHLDPDQLALLALGEPVGTDEDRAHLADCAACTAELAEMRHAVSIARSTLDESDIEAPPERVWLRIADELDLPASRADVPAESPPPVPRRRRARVLWTLAASLVAVAAIGLGVWATTLSLRPTEIAAATLSAFPDHAGAAGTADVEETRDGDLRIRVTLDSAPPTDAYREVWLIRNDAAALVSLGILESSSGVFPIPAGIDLTEYSLVDISVEPVDGDPQHSGDSIVRGELHFV